MIVIVAPEQADWIDPLQRSLKGPVRIIALWKSQNWQLVRALKAAWVRGRTDRAFNASFALRALVDEVVSRRLPKGTTTLIAPSLGAAMLFRTARLRGIETVLVEDLSNLTTLHADLDEAVVHHPLSPWLTRYRAGPRCIDRQQREWDVADRILVRSAFAREQHISAGRIAEPLPAKLQRLGPNRKGRLVLFAGLAAARNGIFEAVEATRRAGLTLLVRTGEGSERVFLQGHPHVREATTVERDQLAGVGVVLAPAWCESHPREIALAEARETPIVATDRAACFARDYEPVERGDIWGIVAALGRVLDPHRVAA